MNTEVLKYSIKVWLSSVLLSVPLVVFGTILYEMFYRGYNPYTYGYIKLSINLLKGTLPYCLPFLPVFVIIIAFLKRESNDPLIIKKILTGIGIFTILFLVGLEFENHSRFRMTISSLRPIILLSTSIFFIWIFELKTIPETIENDDILDV